MKRKFIKGLVAVALIMLFSMPVQAMALSEEKEELTDLGSTWDNEVEIQVEEDQAVESVGAGSVTLKRPLAKASIDGDGICVSWDRVENAKVYRLYRSYSETGTKTMISETAKLSYTDSKCKSGKRAYYFVRAINGDVRSSLSDVVSDKIYRVYIETGHGVDSTGKWDSGCKWNGYQEAKLMIPIAKYMTYYMRKSNVYVYTDAYSGNDTNLFWALDFMKKHSISAFVNIHCDYSKAKPGTLPLYRTAEQKKLAIALNKGVHSTVSIKDRGICRRTDLDTLNSSKVGAPACLFETGSIKGDNTLLRTKYKSYGKGLAKGLCSYIGVSFVE